MPADPPPSSAISEGTLLDQIALSQLVPTARGRKSAPLVLDFCREIAPSDIDLVVNPPPVGSQTPALLTLRHRHHLLARLLAEGRRAVEVSAITGQSQSRISILQRDPAFAELVQYYAQQKEAVYLDVHQRLATLGIDTLEELHERLAERPELFANKELFQLAELALDRSVAPPKNLPGPGGQSPSSKITIQFVHPDAPEGTIIDVEALSKDPP